MPHLALLLPLALASAAPGSPSVTALPSRVSPGDAFLLVVRGTASAPAAEVAGRALSFFATPGGFAAVAGLPVEESPGRLRVEVTLPGERGRPGDTTAGLVTFVEVAAPRFPVRALTVGSEYVAPPSPELAAHIEADRAALLQAFEQRPSPPLFRGRFVWPRHARVSARFGEKRTLNGVKPSQHYGLDLAGPLGAPVSAAQDGRVVLVRDCWASGLTVVLWHGAGLSSTYLHLSRALVREGDRVVRGEVIGEVGQSGRAAGPHLHWGVKVGDLYVDPESVLRLAF